MKDYIMNLLTARSVDTDTKNKQEGFTLIELMIVIAIVAILASLALPAYQTYAKKAKFSEVVMATTGVKSAMDICYQTRGDVTTCAASSSVSNSSTNAATGSNVSSVSVGTTGTLTAVGAASVDAATYIITPTATNGSLVWALDATSTCLAEGLCDDRPL